MNPPKKITVAYQHYDAEDDSIVIDGIDTSWNDFGYHTRTHYTVYIEGHDPINLRAHIGIIDSKKSIKPSTYANELNAKLESIFQGVNHDFKYFTLLRDTEQYRQIVRELGPAKAKNALLSVNDLVALKEFGVTLDGLDDFESSDVFRISFLRSSEAFFAFKNAGSILRGMFSEEVGVLPETLTIEFSPPTRCNSYNLQFKFNHSGDLPKRISIIIGKNGVGKSQTLAQIARSAIKDDGKLRDGKHERPAINRLLAFAPTNETNSVFPSDKRLKSNIWYRRFSLNRSSRRKGTDGLAGLIVQLARGNQRIGRTSRWDIFCQALTAISDHEQLCLRLNRQSSINFEYIQGLTIKTEMHLLDTLASIDTNSEPTRAIGDSFYQLSSGELSFIKFAAQASLNIENGSLLLLDEPETHLHPNFISRFALLLDTLLELTGSSAIIATHSAYFVREVFREQVSVLGIEENQIIVRAPLMQTFGADVGALSYFVFGEDEPSRLAINVEKRLIKKELSWPKLYEKYKDDLSLEFLNSLRNEIEG